MAETDISICSQALVILGAEPISSFQDETDAARICSNVYEGVKNNLMSSYGWRFLMEKRSLTKDAQAPVGEWENSFILPGDAIGLTHAVFENAQHKVASNEFEIFGRRIYTNHDTLIADYVTAKPESEWTAYFADLVVSAMCAKIGFAITDQQSVSDSWEVKTFGTPSEMGMGGKMGKTMSLDAQADGNIGLVNDAFTDARFGTFGYENTNQWK